MNQELEGLIPSYQTTLNMLDAHNFSLDLSTNQIVLENLNNDQLTQLTAIASTEETYSSKSHQVLAEAKKTSGIHRINQTT